MKHNKAVIITSCVISIVLIIIIIINYQRMKQSVKGVLGKSYFTIDELCASSTAKKYNIDNTPTPEVRTKLQALIDNVLDPARRELGSYIRVTSGYRCPELNKKVNGAATSQHLLGEAADITAGSEDKNRKLFAILVGQASFDQLIWEHTAKSQWIHVSYRAGRLRKEILAYNGSAYTNITDNWENKLV